MKGVLGLGVFLVGSFWVVSFFVARAGSRDPGHQLAVAFDAPRGDDIQIMLGVGPALTLRDPIDRRGRVSSWKEWIPVHFELRDESDTVVPLSKMGTAKAFLDARAAGAPEFVLWAYVKQGGTYTFEYTPVDGEAKTYRAVIDIPRAPVAVSRQRFSLVEPT